MKIIRKTNILVKTSRKLEISQTGRAAQINVCKNCGESIFDEHERMEILKSCADEAEKVNFFGIEEIRHTSSSEQFTEKFFRAMTDFFSKFRL